MPLCERVQRAFCDSLYLCSANILCIYTQHQSYRLLPWWSSPPNVPTKFMHVSLLQEEKGACERNPCKHENYSAGLWVAIKPYNPCATARRTRYNHGIVLPCLVISLHYVKIKFLCTYNHIKQCLPMKYNWIVQNFLLSLVTLIWNLHAYKDTRTVVNNNNAVVCIYW